jgi:hypothetical protein
LHPVVLIYAQRIRGMAENEVIDRPKRRLRWEGTEPLADISSWVVDALSSRVRILLAWRETGVERPLTSLLTAFLLRFAAGRSGWRHAKS